MVQAGSETHFGKLAVDEILEPRQAATEYAARAAADPDASRLEHVVRQNRAVQQVS
jgi:hypothetical protein